MKEYEGLKKTLGKPLDFERGIVPPERKVSEAARASRKSAGQSWAIIAQALRASPEPKDQRLALDIERFVTGRALDRHVVKDQTRLQQAPQRDSERSR